MADRFGFERRRWWQFWRPLYVEMTDEQMRKFIGGSA